MKTLKLPLARNPDPSQYELNVSFNISKQDQASHLNIV